MSQHDFDIENQTATAARSDINAALKALAGNNSGATQPATTWEYMFWFDTTTKRLKIRNSANSGWITIGRLDDSGGDFHPIMGNWELSHSGEALVFTHAGTPRARLDQNGNLAIAGSVSAHEAL